MKPPMPWLNAGYGNEPGAMAVDLSAVEQRAQDRLFVAHCSLDGLRDRLPLRWPTPPDIPPSPKKGYRSQYVYLGWEDLNDPSTWEHLSLYDITLRLIDFDGLRPVLAHLLGWRSGRGWMPFDPVSMFLLQGWQMTNDWSRAETLRQLHNPRYADYAQRFGFRAGCFPTEGGLRYFLTTLGSHSTSDETITVDEKQGIQVAIQQLNQLLIQSVLLLHEAGFISPEAWEQALLCPDGMLHEAASRLRCTAVSDICYQPTVADKPRPCPAKEKGRHGCDCATAACGQICRHATPRDPDARYVWYTGSNQPDSPNKRTDEGKDDRPKGKGVYGYRSLRLQLADPVRRFSLTLLSDYMPANQREDNPSAALLLQLKSSYPTLHVDAVAGDAAFGYDLPLHVIYADLQARRVIDLRAHETDKDKQQWCARGYDDRGRPICPYGYVYVANGYDPERRRYKWICAHACRKGKAPTVRVEGATYPPEECPYLGSKHPHGCVINIGECFGDGSMRLARDVPVGSSEWKRLYHRGRNAVEGSHATLESWGFKRLRVYGDPRSRALTFQADLWDNLTTMARLVREATAAKGK
jgi:hypothetical protein